MKERPILLKAQEITAILEGRKTQLRRVLTPQPEMVVDAGKHSTYSYRGGLYALDMYKDNSKILEKFPLGQIGEHLWVHETPTLGYDVTCLVSESDDEKTVSFTYKLNGMELHRNCPVEAAWKLPIHTPLPESRIFLEITKVRIERLNDISEADCVKEGIGSAFLRDCKKPKFIEQWGQIHGPDTWSKNPWVWVIDFRVIEGGAV